MRSVSIIGMGETAFGKHPNRSFHNLITEAGELAIKDAGIEKKSIEAVYVGNFNGAFLAGQNHFGPMVSEVLGLDGVPAMRVEGACASGSLAFRQGLLSIMCGMHDIVLVGGVEKMTHQASDVVTRAVASGMDVEHEAKLGLTFPSAFAMIAQRYFYEYRNIKKEMGLCAVNAHNNALLNLHAQMKKKISLEDVLEANFISDPLSIYDCSLVSDGAAFLVLATKEIADSIAKENAVDVLACEHTGDNLTLYSKEKVTSFKASVNAAKKAFEKADLSPADIDFAEVHDCFTITQIINTEDIGFFKAGQGADAVSEGITALDGKLPINPSGGLKAKGHPIGATGIGQIYEIVSQLRHKCGERQIANANIGLAHNMGGAGATCVVSIFKGR